jgi:hypothetical protein
MKLSTFYSAFLLVKVITILPGCEVIGGIFKAGVWTGVAMIAIVVAVIIFIISKLNSKGKLKKPRIFCRAFVLLFTYFLFSFYNPMR